MAEKQEELIIVPVRNIVLFPGTVLPLTVGRARSVAAAQEAVRSRRPIGVLLQREAATAEPGFADLYSVGTTATVARFVTAPDGSHHLIVHGEQRFTVQEFLQSEPYILARVLLHEEEETKEREVEARGLYLKERAIEAVQLLSQTPAEVIGAIQAIESPGALADLVASLMDVNSAETQQILETFALEDRQKEAVLREQLRQIRRELGESEEGPAQVQEIKQAIEAAGMPQEVREHAERELRRLERMPEASPEYSMVATYLEWLTAMP